MWLLHLPRKGRPGWVALFSLGRRSHQQVSAERFDLIRGQVVFDSLLVIAQDPIPSGIGIFHYQGINIFESGGNSFPLLGRTRPDLNLHMPSLESRDLENLE